MTAGLLSGPRMRIGNGVHRDVVRLNDAFEQTLLSLPSLAKHAPSENYCPIRDLEIADRLFSQP